MKRIFSVFFLALFGAVLALQAQVRLPRFFADGMVLQRGEPIPVWGWAPAGTSFEVTLGRHRAKVVADASGRWEVTLPKMKAGGPYELRAGEVCLHDVLIGDVYLCSGQSNMELPVRRCMDVVASQVKDYANSQVRYLKLPHQYNYVRPNEDVQTQGWQSVSPSTCGEMGALCYFLGRNLQESAGVPVGIVNSSVGGTRVACWMSRDTLLRHPEYVGELSRRKYFQQDWPDSISRLEAVRSREWEREMQRKDTVSVSWRTPGHSFASWPVIDIFSRWAQDVPAGGTESHGPRIYGAYWFRHTVLLSGEQAERKALLRLGAMKDADSVFVNGHFVGSTSYEYPPRNYTVPAGVLRRGENEIVVKLMAQSGMPNFTQGKLYQIETADGNVVPIDRHWQMARGAVMEAKPGSTYFVDTPTGLYNAMIAPLRQFPFRGVVWYQGESDQGQAAPYGSLLCSLIRNWRNQFNRPRLPFIVVQLAGFMQRHDQALQSSGWCDIRLRQYETAVSMPYTSLATAIDLGEYNDIHPQRKDELGRRVALQIRRAVYGEKKLVAEGPRPLSAKRVDNKIVVSYAPSTGRIAPSDHLDGFTVAAADHRYVSAKGRTVGDHTVEVNIPSGMNPVSLRYAYDDYPVLSVFNTDSLPSPAFSLPVSK